jgi:hypothetical protein
MFADKLPILDKQIAMVHFALDVAAREHLWTRCEIATMCRNHLQSDASSSKVGSVRSCTVLYGSHVFLLYAITPLYSDTVPYD